VDFEVGSMWTEVQDEAHGRLKSCTLDVMNQADMLRTCVLQLAEPLPADDAADLARRKPRHVTSFHANLLKRCSVSVIVAGAISRDDAEAISRWASPFTLWQQGSRILAGPAETHTQFLIMMPATLSTAGIKCL
jgi:hypothetical protein